MTTSSGDFSVVNRFTTRSKGWSCELRRIEFSTSRDICVLGIGLYGGTSNWASVKVSRMSDLKKFTADNKVDFAKCSIKNGIAQIFFDSPIIVHADAWYNIEAVMSGPRTEGGTYGASSVESDGVTFSFRSTDEKPGFYTGQLPEIYFEGMSHYLHRELKMLGNEFKCGFEKFSADQMKKDYQEEVENVRAENGRLIEALTQQRNRLNDSSKELHLANHRITQLLSENERMRQQVSELRGALSSSKIGALRGTSRRLKFEEREKLAKLFVTIQLQSGALLYFDNAKTSHELFTENDCVRIQADLGVLQGEYDCSFKGVIEDVAYFAAVKGKIARFFKAYISDRDMKFEQMNELSASDIIPFDTEPMYFIEESDEWIVYKYNEHYKAVEGEKFSLNGLRFIRKFKVHYHRGILYFFRENNAPKLEKLNEKVVIIEGPVLDGPLSFHTPPHSDFIYITNSDQNVLLTLDTTDLNVSQQSYDPPIESDHHSIVGVHERILTMVFEGKGGVGRWLYTTRIE